MSLGLVVSSLQALNRSNPSSFSSFASLRSSPSRLVTRPPSNASLLLSSTIRLHKHTLSPLRRHYSTDDSSSNCRCKGQEIVIPTQKKHVGTKTTINTTGENVSDKPKADTINKAAGTPATATPIAEKASTAKPSKPKPLPGGLPVSTDEEAWKMIASFGKYLWPSSISMRARVAGAVALLVIAKVVNVQVPILFKNVIDSNFVAEDGSGLSLAAMGLVVSYGVARSTASLFHELRSVVFSPVSQIAIRHVATQTFLHIHAMDLNWHLSRQTGGLSRAVDRGTRGIQQVLNALLFTILPTALEISLVAGLLGYQFGWEYAALTFAAVGCYGLYTFLITKWRTKFRIEMNRLDSQAATVALDSLMNYETVKYFNNEKLEVGRYEEVLKKYDVAQLKTTSSLALLNWGQNVVFSGALVAGMVMAGQGIAAGVMTVGDVVMVNGLLMQMALPLNWLGSTYREVRQSLIDMSTMFKLLDLKSAVTDRPGAKELVISPNGGEISFKDVEFGYVDDTSILRGASFTVPAGKKVAIVGTSGGGKSTILRLLYRFYDADSGSVSIDGNDVRDLTLESLRKSIGVVPQDLVLFNESIYYNIRYGNPSATQEQVEAAARAANVHDAIMRMPDGYNTPVGERGLKLSGGEKQRVCLARALLKNPPILILDEATSSLDSESESAVQVAIDNVVSGGRTVLMISHRLKTVHNADKILVLHGGQVVEEGTHDSLMAKNGYYHSLVQKQNLISSDKLNDKASEL